MQNYAWELKKETRAHTHTRAHARTHARTHTHTHAHTHARTHTHTHARTHALTEKQRTDTWTTQGRNGDRKYNIKQLKAWSAPFALEVSSCFI